MTHYLNLSVINGCLLTNPDPNVKISTIGCQVEQDHDKELI